MSEQTEQLDNFDYETRMGTLEAIAASSQFPAPGPNFNMHCHSFFSYNSEGWSPAHIALNCASKGLYAAALCDFDVLDGLEEFLKAAQLLSLRSAVHLETRAYVPKQSDVNISSPGEPGVAYIMGCGFPAIPAAASDAGKTLAQLRQGAQDRNLALIARINEALPAIAIDYDNDVVPLTPKGVATERHIVRAYRVRANEVFLENSQRAEFWAPLLKCSTEEFAGISENLTQFEDLIRNALAKRGGIGYIQPTDKTFPLADDFINWVKSCDAIPTIAWLDGTSDGEADAEKLVKLMTAKGCAALNIIPDRNWNIKDPDTAALKQKNLDDLIQACVSRDMPINIGTEMNKGGLPFVDDITGPVLNKYADLFTEGANIMVGQTILARYAGCSYCSDKAASKFSSIKEKNTFFSAVGALPALTKERADELLAAGPDATFEMLETSIS
ncbi:MAG: hypothetical protein PF904_12315 [Kiritimatiellae bacterium]|jgi:hypothetical protein|nr:hypothetical protein [Kiritimatiellia bacterium]